MIRKLRIKFILINMLSVFLVLATVFGVLLYSSAKRLTDSSNEALVLALSRDGNDDQQPWEIGGGKKAGTDPLNPNDVQRLNENNTFIRTFTVSVYTDGTLSTSTYSGEIDISDDILNAAVETALADPDGAGTISDLHLRYLVKIGTDSTKIAFADTSSERIYMNNLIIISLEVGVPALAVFFLLAYFLSGLALKPAKTAWQQQQQFVADASHELKTPLTVILANTDILLAHPSASIQSQRKWIENTKTEGERMKKLADNLLFLAKSDAAEHVKANPMPHEQVNLSDTAWNALLPFESVAFEQGVELNSDIKPNVTVSGNADQLNRLIVILIDNACKYSGKSGSVTLTLTKEQGKAKLSVHNTGTPIDKDDLPHIFDRFYRADKSRSQVYDEPGSVLHTPSVGADDKSRSQVYDEPGSVLHTPFVGAGDQSRAQTSGGHGLGLSIAKSIVDAHNGKLTVNSSAEHGTTFTAEFSAK
ncbi:MAG TPA: sensor histidine kinase [Oscillospiraceae bacterium]|nr:sensor histidine kinase [Oscillospiraceae bacterium]HPF55978.1 sensor histidine kinase [Clostridiales bacterium]HPK34438.1 sensor histidine kinase [Oscillospiraceae bacterium]HPR75577.1 sensor histidine kinase [Oscillospiraceae bacterium]